MLRISLLDAAQVKVDIAKMGLSIRGFAREINVSSGYLAEVLGERQEPSASFAYKVAHGLGENIEDIFLIEVLDKTAAKEM